MTANKIDNRLDSCGTVATDTKWLNARDAVFSLHGVLYDESQGVYTRIPKKLAESLNSRILMLSYRTSGGRIRFLTNSPYVALRVSLPAFRPISNMPITLTHGFSLYVNGKFEHRFAPNFDVFLSGHNYSKPLDSRIHFEASASFFDVNADFKLCEIYFPLYGGVADIEIGIKNGANIKKAHDYKIKRPLVFYGSSITQGACVSRPGNDFLSILSRKLDCDYVNLGFSGHGNAEDEIIDYMCSIDASLYAYDYNLYGDRPDRILPPHYSVYERIRRARPGTPILFYDKPFFDFDTTYERRRNIIKESYRTAKNAGDDLVGNVEAEKLFGNEDRDCCVADGAHPNDLGALRMAYAFLPVVSDLIKRSTIGF